jgi:hypothetical protein
MLKDIFKNDVTREIPPVIYFHEQTPEQIESEVSEYIITGGWPKDHPNHQRVPNGIHEQYTKLLTKIAKELDGYVDLPASWISGFYGSGKSSFAKLLGLALDGIELPSGKSVADALLERDSSPKRKDLIKAWKELRSKIDPIAVVFDIGGFARENEHIPSAILRQMQKRLGYCSRYPNVARFELKLERSGDWQDFCELCEAELDMPWKEAKEEEWADENFSLLLHKLRPKNYPSENDWLDTWGGKELNAGSAQEIVQDVSDMLNFRAHGKTMFIVVDEVSQYIHQNEGRMLSLQSFVSELGAKLRGQVWLLVTGQQKLEETSTSEVLGKLKDRFPDKLRVHLAPSNIRDVVHKRLLEKKEEAKPVLREMFNDHRSTLDLYAYGCKDISVDEFVEVYPMLPGQIDLLMEITSIIRVRSDRTQGDVQAIRGLMQMLGELFREQELGNQPMGALISIDQFYDLQSSSLPSEMQESLSRIFNKYAKEKDDLLPRVIKAVALLSMVNEKMPTNAKLVAQNLFNRVDLAPQEKDIEAILERLCTDNVLGYSPKLGYSIHSSAAQEWQRERDEKAVSANRISDVVQDNLKSLLAALTNPKRYNRPIPWSVLFSDNAGTEERILKPIQDKTKFILDLYFLTEERERTKYWFDRSSEEDKQDRLLWLSGRTDKVEESARQLIRSTLMCSEYQPLSESLNHSQNLCLLQEKSRREDFQRDLRKAIEECWIDGKIYFRGREVEPHTKGRTLKDIFVHIGEEILPDIFPHMQTLRVTDDRLKQLLEQDLSGIAPEFMTNEHGGVLGIFSLENNKYIAACTGVVPSQIEDYIKRKKGIGGGVLLDEFMKPPYGYEQNVILACVAGILRAERIEIHDDGSKQVIQHFRDPGAKDVLELSRRFRKATIAMAKESEISRQDRGRLCKFFKKYLDAEVERDNGAIADAVERYFPPLQEQLNEVRSTLNSLPGERHLPTELELLNEAINACVSIMRQTQTTVKRLKLELDALNDGIPKLRAYRSELNTDAIKMVLDAHFVLDTHVAQLDTIDALSETQREHVTTLKEQLNRECPWREIHQIEPALLELKELYQTRRKEKLNWQQKQVNESLAKLRLRNGFDKLDSDDAHRVLKPINDARTETSETATTPSLSELEASFRLRLHEAEQKSDTLLDTILSVGDGPSIVKIDLELRNKELETEEQVDALLKDIRERLMAQLEGKTNIRIRLL